MSAETYTTRLAETLESDSLAELALDLRWSFNHAADPIWQRLDPVLWSLTRNPWFVLQTASRARLEEVANDAEFQQLIEKLVRENRQANESPAWFDETFPHSPLGTAAYFSMEFMVTEALPIYSGGLGNVAGDLLKAATTLGVPVVAVGLLYQQGYFRQTFDTHDRQQALYPFNDPGQLPIRPLRDDAGEWIRFTLDFPGSALWVRVWQAQIGRVRLLLLDTNDPANVPANRGITSELYGGDAELRLKQEIVLGIGGWRMLRAIGLAPEVCHLNEGHAAFAVLERAHGLMIDRGHSFQLGLTVTRAGNLFTTHTPVDAGFDRFAPELMAKYLGPYAEHGLGITLDALLALGRLNAGDRTEPFNMAYLAVRGSGAVNGVSRLHGQVSRRIFQPLFPRWPEAEVPVSHVTNGVHMPSWDSVEADRLWEATYGKDRWRWPILDTEAARGVSDEDLWRLRTDSCAAFVEYVRERLARQLAEQGARAVDVAHAARVFSPAALTIGFARRFATYKRPNLLLHDPDRLARILSDRQRPVQLVVAGKAHPRDAGGQALIEQWMSFVHRPDVRGRVVFLSDYDMLMAERLVQGIDLWINTPRRPWEACGTSGMKVLVNGGLNLSELDGWWAEAYAPEVGWAIGDRGEHGDDTAWDAAEADALYGLLERDVLPAFYTRRADGIPDAWVARMRESMARLTPAFSANRMVREYTVAYYVPLATAYRARAAGNGEAGAALLSWKTALEGGWRTAKFCGVEVSTEGAVHAFRVRVDLGTLDPEAVAVELYADGPPGGQPSRTGMTRGEAESGAIYQATVPASRPASQYTPRLVPVRAGVAVPLEAPFVLWNDARR